MLTALQEAEPIILTCNLTCNICFADIFERIESMAEPLRALVVDDIPANRLVAEEMLSELGWSVMTAVDGREGLQVLDSASFDLVVLDISMPGMSGIEMCQKIRANNAYTELPVIAYTAHAQPEDRRNFIASGFNEVLIKPINRATLVSAVASATQHLARNR